MSVWQHDSSPSGVLNMHYGLVIKDKSTDQKTTEWVFLPLGTCMEIPPTEPLMNFTVASDSKQNGELIVSEWNGKDICDKIEACKTSQDFMEHKVLKKKSAKTSTSTSTSSFVKKTKTKTTYRRFELHQEAKVTLPAAPLNPDPKNSSHSMAKFFHTIQVDSPLLTDIMTALKALRHHKVANSHPVGAKPSPYQWRGDPMLGRILQQAKTEGITSVRVDPWLVNKMRTWGFCKINKGQVAMSWKVLADMVDELNAPSMTVQKWFDDFSKIKKTHTMKLSKMARKTGTSSKQ